MIAVYKRLMPYLCGICCVVAVLAGSETALAQERWEPLIPGAPITGVSTLAYHPSGRLFIGFKGGGVGIIENGTLTFADVSNNDASIVRFQFAGTDTSFAWLDPTRFDMLRSVDGGATWHPVREPHRLWPPLATTNDGTVVSMLYEPGIQVPKVRSTDGGTTWARIDSTQFDAATITKCIDMTAGPDGKLYAGFQGDSTKNLYRSDDRGATWRSLDLAAGNIHHIIATETGAILAATMTHLFDPKDVRGIYRSSDAGETWSLTLPLGFNSSNPIPTDVAAAIPPAYSPRGGIMVIVTGSEWNVMRSIDDGQTWQSMTTRGMVDTLVVAIGASADGEIVSATLENVYRYINLSDTPIETEEGNLKPETHVENGEVVITFQQATGGEAKAELYDMNARRIRMVDADLSGGTRQIVRIDVSNLSSATYILVMQIGEMIYARQVSIVR